VKGHFGFCFFKTVCFFFFKTVCFLRAKTRVVISQLSILIGEIIYVAMQRVYHLCDTFLTIRSTYKFQQH